MVAPSIVTKGQQANADSKADTDADPEGKANRRWRTVEAYVGIDRRAIDSPWVVIRHIHDFRVSRLDDDLRAVLFNHLLRGITQLSRLAGAVTHGLNRAHHVCRLIVVGIAQRNGPLLTLGQHVQHLGKLGQRFDAGVPWHLVHSLGQLLRRLIAILLHPALGLLNLLRIGGSRERLRDERVRVKCDRRNQSLQFLRALRDVGSLATVLWRRPLLARIARILVRILLLRRWSILRHQAELCQRQYRCTKTEGNTLPQGALPQCLGHLSRRQRSFFVCHHSTFAAVSFPLSTLP